MFEIILQNIQRYYIFFFVPLKLLFNKMSKWRRHNIHDNDEDEQKTWRGRDKFSGKAVTV